MVFAASWAGVADYGGIDEVGEVVQGGAVAACWCVRWRWKWWIGFEELGQRTKFLCARFGIYSRLLRQVTKRIA